MTGSAAAVALGIGGMARGPLGATTPCRRGDAGLAETGGASGDPLPGLERKRDLNKPPPSSSGTGVSVAVMFAYCGGMVWQHAAGVYSS